MAKRIPKLTPENAEHFELEAQGFSESAAIVAEEQKEARNVAVRETEERIEAATKLDSLAERGAKISNDIRFSDIKKIRMGDQYIAVPEDTWTNRRIVLDYLFKGAEDRPHFCEYKGRIVDHKGVIVDDFYDGTDYVDAYNAVGLRKLEAKKVIEAVRDFALRHRQNDLKVRIASLIPAWDGVERIRTSLCRMFESHDTPLNRTFSEYFWLSLYCRCMFPGEEAPIVLTLIGAQNSGKSYFGKLLARMITGDPEADSVQLDLSGQKVDFLREITGQSVIASVGEMQGFNRSDLNRVKDFVSRTHDKFHYKFEGVVHQARQWVTVMDANRYEGLLRDDSGNRRFYPMFCGQLPDVAGEQQWKREFKADFSELRENLWQLFAEAKAWIDSKGLDEYRDFVRGVSKQVFDFSAEEMTADRGTVKDEEVEPYVTAALASCECIPVRSRGEGGEWALFFPLKGLTEEISFAAPESRDPTKSHRYMMDVKKALKRRGSDGKLQGHIVKRDDGKRERTQGFFFRGHKSVEELLASLDASNQSEFEETTEAPGAKTEQATDPNQPMRKRTSTRDKHGF